MIIIVNIINYRDVIKEDERVRATSDTCIESYVIKLNKDAGKNVNWDALLIHSIDIKSRRQLLAKSCPHALEVL